MNQPTMFEIYQDHYETLNEEKRVAFLLNLKREGKTEEFRALALRWIQEKIAE